MEEERFRSLTELKWGEFEAMGFGGLDPAEKKLQFDLTESARTVCLDLSSVVLQMFMYRVAVASGKTNVLTWTDFSSTGFTRTDVPLSATLQFSTSCHC